jgi:hypothetical protein
MLLSVLLPMARGHGTWGLGAAGGGAGSGTGGAMEGVAVHAAAQ